MKAKNDRTDRITGQLYFRNFLNQAAPTKDGRKVVLVFGLLAVPEECLLEDECKYPVDVTTFADLVAVDRGEKMTRTWGWLPDDILDDEHWKC